MKEQIKAPQIIQLRNEEIANLSDAQFKTLVNRMLQDLTGYFNSMKKTQAAMKVAWGEIKKNVQGTNNEGKEIGTEINDLEQEEEINIPLEKNEGTRIQKKKWGEA